MRGAGRALCNDDYARRTNGAFAFAFAFAVDNVREHNEPRMPSQYVRLMDTRTLGPSQTCPRELVVDLGAFRAIVLDPRILTVGGAGNLLIETASVNEEGAFRVVATIVLTATAAMSEIPVFLRYIRWRTDAGVTGNPVVVVDLVAKGG